LCWTSCANLMWKVKNGIAFTSRNQPKCNHSIYDYMRLDLRIFATIRPNFNYFGHSHNYDATIKNFILLVGSILHLFSSINRLICLISCNSHQISCILKVFYNNKGVYFNVCTKIYLYIICIRMYIVHIMNFKINIWTLNFLFKSENWYFNFENYYFNYIYIYIRIWSFIIESENCYFNCLKHYLNFKFLIWIWYLNSKLIFLNPKISISIQKIINWL